MAQRRSAATGLSSRPRTPAKAVPYPCSLPPHKCGLIVRSVPKLRGRSKQARIIPMRSLGALALVGLLGSAPPTLADLRSSLAQRFQADPPFFILNLPPRPGGWPGSIYTLGMQSTLIQGDPSDDAAGSSTPFDIVVDVDLDLSGEAEEKLLPLA